MARGSNKAELKLVVEAILKDEGILKAQARIGDLEKKVAGLKSQLNSASAVSSNFGSALAGALSVGAIAAFARQTTVEFAKVDRQWSATSFMMKNLGMAADEELPKVQQYLAKIAEGGGPLASETLPVFQRFIGITKDTNSALYATQLAADVSETGMMEVGQAADLITNLLQGKAGPAAKQFGIALYDASGKAKSGAQLLAELEKKVGGAGDAFSDTQNQIDKAAAEWEEFKLSVGKGISILLGLVGGINGVTRAFKSLGPIAVKTFYEVLGFFNGLAGAAAKVFDFDVLFKEGWGKYKGQVAEAYKSGIDSYKLEIEGAREELDKIWEDWGQPPPPVDKDAGREKFARQAALKAKEERDKQIQLEKKAAEEIAAANQKALTERLKAEADLLPQHSQARLNAQLSLLDRELQNEIKAAEASGRATTDIYARYLALRQGMINDQLEWELQKIQEAAEQTLRDKEAGEQRDFEIRQEGIDLAIEAAEGSQDVIDQLEMQRLKDRQDREEAAEKNPQRKEQLFRLHEKERENLEKKQHNARMSREKQERQAKLESAATTMGALAQLFPKVKAFGLAEAMINMYAGVSAALDEKPWWAAVARVAWTLATGWAQINAIRSQNMARGGITTGPVRAMIGEDPNNPGEAVLPLDSAFGKRALSNALGVALKTAQGPAGVTNQNTVQHVTHVHEGDRFEFHGTLIDEHSIRQFMRRADRVRSQDKRLRTVR